MADEQKKPRQFSVLWLLVIGGAAWFIFGGGAATIGASNTEGIYRKVANDAVEQYNIATRQGSAMDVCVQAGMVAAAFLQAKDEGQYATWKNTERIACAKAGLPR